MFFSIIIPFYNNQTYLFDAVNSALSQRTDDLFLYEVILIDDCSSDNSYKIAEQFCSHKNVILEKTTVNSGPGVARDKGVGIASGRYLLFLDSDDFLGLDALIELHRHIQLLGGWPDLVAYEWNYSADSTMENIRRRSGRRDIPYVLSEDGNVVENYLSMKMDGSVIYSLIKRELIVGNNIKFRSGLHEDIDYIFKVYYFAEKVSYLDQCIYLKRNHPSSIINTITVNRIEGYMAAWKEIFGFVYEHADPVEYDKLFDCFKSGLTGALGTLLVSIGDMSNDDSDSLNLYKALYMNFRNNFPVSTPVFENYLYPLPNDTAYDQLANCFISAVEDESDGEKIEDLRKCHDHYR